MKHLLHSTEMTGICMAFEACSICKFIGICFQMDLKCKFKEQFYNPNDN